MTADPRTDPLLSGPGARWPFAAAAALALTPVWLVFAAVAWTMATS
jgi:hypothetical protein